MNAKLMLRIRIASVSLIVVVVIGFSPLAFAELEFVTQNIGHPVQYFEPVDIESDGIWELALQVGKNSDSVGVYSPLRQQWIDGPHYLPVQGNNWGCGDFDGDGKIEYVHFDDNRLWVYYPEDQRDTALFTVEYAPKILQIWGCSSHNDSFVYLSYLYTYSNFVDCGFPGYSLGTSYSYGEWRRYSITEGTASGTVKAPYTLRGNICFVDQAGITPLLCTSESDIRVDEHCGETYYSCSYVISLLPEPLLAAERTTVVSERGNCCEWPICYPGVGIYYKTIGASDDESGYDVFYIIKYEVFPRWQRLEAIKSLTAGTTWAVDLGTESYSGLTYFDWYGDSSGVLFMPTTNRNLWEIRDPQTGALIDSIPGLPRADIRTAPILETDKLDLYYFLDSTLYILERPGMSTGILAEDEATGIPGTFTLRQNYPNPFNASTIIEFAMDQPGLVKLEIYNILGKKVAVLLDEYCPAGTHRVSWEGTGPDGTDLVSGIYFARLAVDGSMQTRKMTLLK